LPIKVATILLLHCASFVSGLKERKITHADSMLNAEVRTAQLFLWPKRLGCSAVHHMQSMESPELCSDYRKRPRKDHRGVRSTFRCAAIRSPLGRASQSNQQCNQPCEMYFAFLVWDSVRARHTSIAETAVRPSQGRRSRNVITMVALS
jgi:hypothetical protein